MYIHLPVIINYTTIALTKFIHNHVCIVITAVRESKAAHC